MAKKKSASHDRVMLTVPQEIKRGMAKNRGTNWSSVAARAFRVELDAISNRKRGTDMASVRERLKASKEAGETESYHRGFDEGREWAMQTAEYAELKRLAGERDECSGSGAVGIDDHFDGKTVRWGDGLGGPADWLARSIRGPGSDSRDWSQVWEDVFGEDEAGSAAEDDQRLRGFLYGALDVFDEAGV